jgi:hypothetical protein
MDQKHTADSVFQDLSNGLNDGSIFLDQDEEHPIDNPIGNLNGVAIKLAMMGEHTLASVVAKSAEDIQKWVLTLPELGIKKK